MANNKNQHYVPSRHLVEWIYDPDRILTYSYDLEKNILHHRQNVRDIFSKSYFNDSENIQMDGLLSVLEREAWPILYRLKESSYLSLEDRLIVSRFLAAQKMRTPFAKESITKVTLDFMKEKIKNKLASPDDCEKMAKELLEGGKIRKEQYEYLLSHSDELISDVKKLDIGNQKDLFLSSMQKQMGSMSDKYYQYEWALLEAPKGSSFITSDNPVSTTSMIAEAKESFHENVELIEVHFPISPAVTLRLVNYLGATKNPPALNLKRAKLSTDEVREVNLRMIIESDRFIISQNEALLKSLAKKFGKYHQAYKSWKNSFTYMKNNIPEFKWKRLRHISIKK